MFLHMFLRTSDKELIIRWIGVCYIRSWVHVRGGALLGRKYSQATQWEGQKKK